MKKQDLQNPVDAYFTGNFRNSGSPHRVSNSK